MGVRLVEEGERQLVQHSTDTSELVGIAMGLAMAMVTGISCLLDGMQLQQQQLLLRRKQACLQSLAQQQQQQQEKKKRRGRMRRRVWQGKREMTRTLWSVPVASSSMMDT
jgi:hypothetical protein